MAKPVPISRLRAGPSPTRFPSQVVTTSVVTRVPATRPTVPDAQRGDRAERHREPEQHDPDPQQPLGHPAERLPGRRGQQPGVAGDHAQSDGPGEDADRRHEPVGEHRARRGRGPRRRRPGHRRGDARRRPGRPPGGRDAGATGPARARSVVMPVRARARGSSGTRPGRARTAPAAQPVDQLDRLRATSPNPEAGFRWPTAPRSCTRLPHAAARLRSRTGLPSGSLLLAATMLGNGSGRRGIGSQPCVAELGRSTGTPAAARRRGPAGWPGAPRPPASRCTVAAQCTVTRTPGAVRHEDHRPVDVLDDPVQQRRPGPAGSGSAPPERRDRPRVRQGGGQPRLPVVLDVAPQARDEDDGRVGHRVDRRPRVDLGEAGGVRPAAEQQEDQRGDGGQRHELHGGRQAEPVGQDPRHQRPGGQAQQVVGQGQRAEGRRPDRLVGQVGHHRAGRTGRAGGEEDADGQEQEPSPRAARASSSTRQKRDPSRSRSTAPLAQPPDQLDGLRPVAEPGGRVQVADGAERVHPAAPRVRHGPQPHRVAQRVVGARRDDAREGQRRRGIGQPAVVAELGRSTGTPAAARRRRPAASPAAPRRPRPGRTCAAQCTVTRTPALWATMITGPVDVLDDPVEQRRPGPAGSGSVAAERRDGPGVRQASRPAASASGPRRDPGGPGRGRRSRRSSGDRRRVDLGEAARVVRLRPMQQGDQRADGGQRDDLHGGRPGRTGRRGCR